MALTFVGRYAGAHVDAAERWSRASMPVMDDGGRIVLRLEGLR